MQRRSIVKAIIEGGLLCIVKRKFKKCNLASHSNFKTGTCMTLKKPLISKVNVNVLLELHSRGLKKPALTEHAGFSRARNSIIYQRISDINKTVLATIRILIESPTVPFHNTIIKPLAMLLCFYTEAGRLEFVKFGFCLRRDASCCYTNKHHPCCGGRETLISFYGRRSL